MRDAARRRCASRSPAPPLRDDRQAGPDGRDLDVRRHPAPAAPPHDPRRARGARRHRRPRRRHVLVATGTHRGNTEQELRRMLGDEVYDSVRVVNHDARDDASSLTWMGEHGDGVPVWLNTRVGAGRPAHHHRLRRAALLRRLQRRPEARRARAGRARHGPHAPRRRPHRPSQRHLGRSSRATPSTTTSAPWSTAVGDVHFALDVMLNREQRIVRGVRRRAVADAPRRVRGRARDGDAARCRRGSRSW